MVADKHARLCFTNIVPLNETSISTLLLEGYLSLGSTPESLSEDLFLRKVLQQSQGQSVVSKRPLII